MRTWKRHTPQSQADRDLRDLEGAEDRLAATLIAVWNYPLSVADFGTQRLAADTEDAMAAVRAATDRVKAYYPSIVTATRNLVPPERFGFSGVNVEE
jgi:hypothetical protein